MDDPNTYDQATCTGPDGSAHCPHWYDGEECHWYGAPEMTDEERIEQGMEPRENDNG